MPTKVQSRTGLSAAALCRNSFHCCEGTVDGGSGDVEQFGEVGDGVVIGAVHAAQLGLLLGRQLRSPVLEQPLARKCCGPSPLLSSHRLTCANS
jgi:hypothetical protein